MCLVLEAATQPAPGEEALGGGGCGPAAAGCGGGGGGGGAALASADVGAMASVLASTPQGRGCGDGDGDGGAAGEHAWHEVSPTPLERIEVTPDNSPGAGVAAAVGTAAMADVSPTPIERIQATPDVSPATAAAAVAAAAAAAAARARAGAHCFAEPSAAAAAPAALAAAPGAAIASAEDAASVPPGAALANAPVRDESVPDAAQEGLGAMPIQQTQVPRLEQGPVQEQQQQHDQQQQQHDQHQQQQPQQQQPRHDQPQQQQPQQQPQQQGQHSAPVARECEPSPAPLEGAGVGSHGGADVDGSVKGGEHASQAATAGASRASRAEGGARIDDATAGSDDDKVPSSPEVLHDVINAEEARAVLNAAPEWGSQCVSAAERMRNARAATGCDEYDFVASEAADRRDTGEQTQGSEWDLSQDDAPQQENGGAQASAQRAHEEGLLQPKQAPPAERSSPDRAIKGPASEGLLPESAEAVPARREREQQRMPAAPSLRCSEVLQSQSMLESQEWGAAFAAPVPSQQDDGSSPETHGSERPPEQEADPAADGAAEPASGGPLPVTAARVSAESAQAPEPAPASACADDPGVGEGAGHDPEPIPETLPQVRSLEAVPETIPMPESNAEHTQVQALVSAAFDAPPRYPTQASVGMPPAPRESQVVPATLPATASEDVVHATLDHESVPETQQQATECPGSDVAAEADAAAARAAAAAAATAVEASAVAVPPSVPTRVRGRSMSKRVRGLRDGLTPSPVPAGHAKTKVAVPATATPLCPAAIMDAPSSQEDAGAEPDEGRPVAKRARGSPAGGTGPIANAFRTLTASLPSEAEDALPPQQMYEHVFSTLIAALPDGPVSPPVPSFARGEGARLHEAGAGNDAEEAPEGGASARDASPARSYEHALEGTPTAGPTGTPMRRSSLPRAFSALLDSLPRYAREEEDLARLSKALSAAVARVGPTGAMRCEELASVFRALRPAAAQLGDGCADGVATQSARP